MMNIANMGQKLVRASLIVAFGTMLAGCNAPADAPPATPPLEGARIGGPFTLTDQNGKTVRDTDFAGKYRLVYFGYSFCPATARRRPGARPAMDRGADRQARAWRYEFCAQKWRTTENAATGGKSAGAATATR